MEEFQIETKKPIVSWIHFFPGKGKGEDLWSRGGHPSLPASLVMPAALDPHLFHCLIFLCVCHLFLSMRSLFSLLLPFVVLINKCLIGAFLSVITTPKKMQRWLFFVCRYTPGLGVQTAHHSKRIISSWKIKGMPWALAWPLMLPEN